MPAAAIAGIAGAGLGLLGASQQAGAVESAAEQQSAAAQYAAQLQQQQFEQTRADLAPWRTVGGSALNQLATMLSVPAYNPSNVGLVDQPTAATGLQGYFAGDTRLPGDLSGLAANYAAQTGQDTGEAAQTGAPDYSAFFQTPGYQFQLEQGQRAIEQSAAARGLLRSGQTLQGITEYGQGVASQAYNDYLNRLASLAGVGQTATTQTGQFGAQSAAAQALAAQQSAAASGQGQIGAAQAWGQGLSQAGQGLGFALGSLYQPQNPYQQYMQSGSTPGTAGAGFFNQFQGGGGFGG